MLDSTRQFIQAMDAKNIKHSDIEVTDSGMEKVTVIYTGDSIPSIRMIFFFNKDCEDVAIRVFDIVKLPENKIDGFFKVVNEANRASASSSSCWTPTTTPFRRRWTPPSAPTTWARSAWS